MLIRKVFKTLIHLISQLVGIELALEFSSIISTQNSKRLHYAYPRNLAGLNENNVNIAGQMRFWLQEKICLQYHSAEYCLFLFQESDGALFFPRSGVERFCQVLVSESCMFFFQQ